MAELVATVVVGPLLSILNDKVSSSLLDQYKVMKGMEEQQEILMRKLPAILDIIDDAEKEASLRRGAAAWLEAIKKVAYEANEVFDEFKYEALRRKAKKEGHYKELGFDVVKLFPTHNRFVFRNRMGRKLRKIVQAIEVLVTEMNAFGFKYQKKKTLVSSQLRQTGHANANPEEIKKIISQSRDNDKNEIVSRLVGQAKDADVMVVPIVGMGGLGKTTLAQLVYNDDEIRKHFDLLLWVCVSDCFDMDSLADSIVKAAPGKKDYGTKADDSNKKNDGTEAAPGKKDYGTKADDSNKTPLDDLHKVLSGQSYLLVLDDVWKRHERIWGELMACLQHGGRGSVVLTTTRDKGLATKMGCDGKTYELAYLEDKFIKEIIERRAFRYLPKEEKRPERLVDMVDEIVKRCAGSPLAATALGSVLCTKTSEQEWKDILTSSSICTEEIGILPILKLSYNDLPSQMKQCFAFCAIFPKDYEIDMNKLIQLWIAHGFIQGRQSHLETIGKQIFDELASSSFFQDVKKVQATSSRHSMLCYSRTTCKIHDLMHDVALSVMEKECALATEETSQSEWLPNTARHLFLPCKDPEKKLDSSLENSFPAIQTLLCDGYMSSSLQHLSKYSSLQALQLHSFGRSFPLKPKHLHHLRYLDLSGSWIKALPEDMSILYNLQTLNLAGCSSLCRLPRQMKYMTSLRHLYTHGCPELKRMPKDLGRLTSLQTLTCFVAGSGSSCSNVGELRNLKLGGQLELCNLANVKEEDAKKANLMNKEELRELTLTWTLKWNYSQDKTSWRDNEEDAKVLENLRPHDELDAIGIHSYGATTVPTWMTVLQNFVVIHLFSCTKLVWLFSRDCDTSFAFPNLKELMLKGLVGLERWWEEDKDGMQGETMMFPLLEKLHIIDCVKLKALPGHPTFPELQNVCIENCPELTTTAKSPKLSVLDMEGYEAEFFLWVARHMTSLTNLKLTSIEHSKDTTSMGAENSLREVVNIKEKGNDKDFPLAVLVLRGFKSVVTVTELCACFVHLQDLSIVRCHGLVHWPKKLFEGLVLLRRLEIENCDNLIGYTQASAEPSTSSETSQLLPRLESLTIWSCENLVELFNFPASLKTIGIYYCGKLESTSGRKVQPGQSVSSIHQGSSSIQDLSLYHCDGLTGVLYLPPSLKRLDIVDCGGLASLESCSPECKFLKFLQLRGCKTLESLPDVPQAYPSLQYLCIRDCPGMKTLPASLQQRLGSIQQEHLDARLYENKPRPMLLKPKTWKYVCKG
ncbi:disease resistance protein RGA2-like [Hordeum vulgare subsp. vulgare]|uniref:disease resistance protein RGA2-like n=1 Tax=Hordeum vulgare subsp. vulgare TaxID=112509 RepID=UPI001D1A570A|nr:disease resistance protein RGA2-like [Hordeum vulgare subsp. vulgare]